MKRLAASNLSIVSGGVMWGGVSFACSMLVLLALKVFLPLAQWGANSGAGALNASLGMQIMVALVWAPLFETLLGQLLPQEVLRRFSVKPVFCIATGSVMWALGHYLNGGIAHGLVALFAGAMFSFIYLRYRSYGVAVSYWMTTVAHLTQNALVLVAASYFPSL
ncbi:MULTISPECIES: type II CAAX prenyl endopeptidase Rce1 family protein [unclassified Duganella]|uniref:CPBP family glutamic-type intramembrane protease n=1 Tax=unclassified Duganella TaxID=2636909 RepID=UPI000E34760A|nr:MULTISPECIES: CPBP family glutamic-type intramembrane protease [unclassified Duganella]RFP14563.1 CPBP family intramembrane metalloprotease [Duganella sp. BJB475]RFP30911.1 CPBP family intramembrane metalloprotease [Duganella sp. BJB476]